MPPGDGGTVVMRPEEFRLPEVLKHIEAGKVVVLMPPPAAADPFSGPA